MNLAGQRRILRLLCCASIACGACVAQASAAQTVDAVWKEQRVTFAHRGADSSYTCAGLRSRLRSILMHLGASELMSITLHGCEDRSDVVVASVTLTSPVEATFENLAEREPHDSRSELIARMRGATRDSAQDLPRFPAVWKTVSFANAMHLRLSRADCNLLLQLRRDVFPRLSIRVINDEIRCSTAIGGITRPRLTVAALTAE